RQPRDRGPGVAAGGPRHPHRCRPGRAGRDQRLDVGAARPPGAVGGDTRAHPVIGLPATVWEACRFVTVGPDTWEQRMNEYSDLDLGRRPAVAGTAFQQRLSEVIPVIDDSADLRISTATASDDEHGPYLVFSAPRRDMVRCEAASNASLDDAYQLGTDQLAQMESSRWRPASTDGDGSTANVWI